jgi:pSer/pThr/pTyr-binding forkhead associated (FHA) protein
MTAFLIVEDGGERRFEVVGRAVIGRDADCDVQLSNLSVSRKHAALEETVAGWVVRDLTSVNGTFVRGKRIEDAVLGTGETLRFGDVKATFRIEERKKETSGTGKLFQTLSVKPTRRARPVAVAVVTIAGIALLVAATVWSKRCGVRAGPAVSATAPAR